MHEPRGFVVDTWREVMAFLVIAVGWAFLFVQLGLTLFAG